MSIQTALPLVEDSALIEQEWCTLCARELGDEPGMAQDVVAVRTLPTDFGPQIFLELTCGHRVISEIEPDWMRPDSLTFGGYPDYAA